MRTALIIILLTLSITAPLFAQQEEERELIYTFVGPVAGFGYNMITYKDWFDDHQGEEKINGFFFSGGGIIAIFSQRFVGDFSVQFMYNTGGGLTVYHFYYASTARYNFHISELFIIAPGGGIFLETPPSNENYGGSAGFIIPVGFYLNTSFDTKLFCDLSFRYGVFGLGEGSTRISFGISFGFIFKVGRI